MAIEVPLPLTTLETFKRYADIEGVSRDDDIRLLIPAVSRLIENYLGGRLLRQSRTEVHDIDFNGQRRFQMAGRWVFAVTSIVHDPARVFGGSGMGTDEYTIDEDDGTIELEVSFAAGRKVLQFTYDGGAAASAQALRSYFPDLERACLVQVKEFMDRTSNPASRFSISEQGGSINVDALDLIPAVQMILHPYKRMIA